MNEFVCKSSTPFLAADEELLPGTVRAIWLSRSMALKLVWCPAGEFWMGSPRAEFGRSPDEPRHRVILSHGFWLGQRQVTQEQYEAVMPQNPSYFRGRDAPVDSVTYSEALQFCRQLTALAQGQNLLTAGYRFCLPSEAQWEYACRTGDEAPFHYGDTLDAHRANFDGYRSYRAEKSPYRQRTCPVGTFAPNAWGLFDMHGNIREWCLDGYGPYRVASGAAVCDPRGDCARYGMVHRGGGWGSCGSQCRSAARGWHSPEIRSYYQGFRVALCKQKSGIVNE